MTSFGAHVPGVPLDLQEINVFPISTSTGGFLDLDYSPLLLMDGLILDRFAYDFVSKRRHFSQMKASIDCLVDEGLIRIEQYETTAKKLKQHIESRVSNQLEYLNLWLDCARDQWGLVKPLISELLPLLGSEADPKIESLHFGIYCYLKNHHGKIDFNEAAKLQRLLETKRKKLSREEIDVLREIIRPLLSYVHLNYGLMQHFGTPFIDWEDLAPYYKRIAQFQVQDGQRQEKNGVSPEMLNQIKQLLNITIPELKPRSAKALVKFIKKGGAVQSLRSALSEAVSTGTVLDSKWINKVRDEANKAQIAARGRSRVVSLVGLVGGVALCWLPMGSEVVRAAVETLAHTSQKAMEHASDPKSLRNYDWYFALLETKDDV